MVPPITSGVNKDKKSIKKEYVIFNIIPWTLCGL
jgi:hypothetical protein